MFGHQPEPQRKIDMAEAQKIYDEVVDLFERYDLIRGLGISTI